MCPAALPLGLRLLLRTVGAMYALAGASNVLRGRGQEWVASGRCIRVGCEGDMQRLLRLRSWRRIGSVGLRRRLVVRIMDHMAIWRPLEWRWSRLAGVHGAAAELRASEELCGLPCACKYCSDSSIVTVRQQVEEQWNRIVMEKREQKDGAPHLRGKTAMQGWQCTV